MRFLGFKNSLPLDPEEISLAEYYIGYGAGGDVFKSPVNAFDLARKLQVNPDPNCLSNAEFSALKDAVKHGLNNQQHISEPDANILRKILRKLK